MIAKGFKGKYFSLQAITATSGLVTLKNKNESILNYFFYIKLLQKESDPPPEEIETLLLDQNSDSDSKPCHCNLFFACLAHKILKLSKIKKPPICRCRKTKSGISPPTSKSDFELFLR